MHYRSAYLTKNGQQLLPMVELIEQSHLAIEELIDAVDRVTLQTVLEMSATQIAGEPQQGSLDFRVVRQQVKCLSVKFCNKPVHKNVFWPPPARQADEALETAPCEAALTATEAAVSKPGPPPPTLRKSAAGCAGKCVTIGVP
jgi:hypothetical protein